MFISILRRLIGSFHVAKLVCGLLLMAFALMATAAEPKATHCDESDSSTFKVPNGVWTARLYGETCDLGLSSSASVVIELVRADNPTSRQVILGMTMPPTKAGRPRLAWESPNKILIDLPSSAEIGLQMAYFQGVEIDVRFCPRDPAARAGWLEYRASYRQWIADTSAWTEKRKQNPDSAGPKPVRPMPPSKVADVACSN